MAEVMQCDHCGRKRDDASYGDACRSCNRGWFGHAPDDGVIAAIDQSVKAVFAHYQRHLQRNGSSRGSEETLIIAASLTAAYFSACSLKAGGDD